jgi:hypothetical protein
MNEMGAVLFRGVSANEASFVIGSDTHDLGVGSVGLERGYVPNLATGISV